MKHLFFSLALLASVSTSLCQADPTTESVVTITGKLYRLQTTLVPLDGGLVIGPVNAPSHLSLCAGTTNSLTLIWKDNSPNETQFAIFRRTAKTDWLRVAVVAPNATVYTDTSLTPDTEYFYRVRATNNQTASDWTAALNAWTQFVPATPSLNPMILRLIDADGRTITAAPLGTEVTIVGERFQMAGTVTFNQQVVPIVSWTDTRIKVKLVGFPEGINPGILIVWRNDGRYTSTLDFQIGTTPAPAPVVEPTPEPAPTPTPAPPPTTTPDPSLVPTITALRNVANGEGVLEGISGEVLAIEGQNLWIGLNSRITVAGKIAAVSQWGANTIRFSLPATTAPITGTVQLWWTVNNQWVLKGQINNFVLKPAP